MHRRAIACLAGTALVVALGAGIAACGGDDVDATTQRRELCRVAADGLAALPATGGRDTVALAAGAAVTTLTDLSAGLAGMDVPAAEAAAHANLRNGVAAAASGYRNLEAVLTSGSASGLGLVVPRTRQAYAAVEAAADALRTPDCGAVPLGRDRFLAYARDAGTPPAALPLPQAARAACARIGEAYGPSAPAIDRAGAVTQLERSRAVLREVTGDLRGTPGARAASLRTAVARADRILATADRAAKAGRNPTTTSQAAFAVADRLLRAAFLRAGVRCSALG